MRWLFKVSRFVVLIAILVGTLEMMASCFVEAVPATNRVGVASSYGEAIAVEKFVCNFTWSAPEDLNPFVSFAPVSVWGIPMKVRRDAPTGFIISIR